MMKVNFYNLNEFNNDTLKFVVIIAKYKGKFIFGKHKERDTWELSGGHIEKGEIAINAAKRELMEETGAKKFEIEPVCIYGVDNGEGEDLSALFYCEVTELGEIPPYEIEQIKLFDEFPKKLTYPFICKSLLRKYREYLEHDYNKIGLRRGTVRLEEHSLVWEENAKLCIQELKEIFKDKAIDIQHIGSTSIKGLKAKPIIDIIVGVQSFNIVQELIPLLEFNGYIHKEENDNEEHIFFSCGDFENDIRTHHIQICIYGDKRWNNCIKFRDVLIKNENMKLEYESLKIELSKKYYNDRVKYTEEKDSFIKKVLMI